MVELFGVQTPAISKHLKNIFEQGELREEVVVSKMEIPTPHGAIPGKTQLSLTNYYNLDAIISVGYRVNSIQATKFRIWATSSNYFVQQNTPASFVTENPASVFFLTKLRNSAKWSSKY